MNHRKIKSLLEKERKLEVSSSRMEEEDLKIRSSIRKLQIRQERLRIKRVDNIKKLSDVKIALLSNDGLCISFEGDSIIKGDSDE